MTSTALNMCCDHLFVNGARLRPCLEVGDTTLHLALRAALDQNREHTGAFACRRQMIARATNRSALE
jgi:hypothetical protein